METLRLASATVASVNVGALVGQQGVTTRQVLSGEIGFGIVAGATGFYKDSVWSDGDGRLTWAGPLFPRRGPSPA